MTQDVQLMIPVQEGCSAVSVLEHVHVKVNINSLSQRGAFSLFLESPSGTISNLLAPRPLDHSVSGKISKSKGIDSLPQTRIFDSQFI